ncbi:MAG: hypothetical protein D4S01_10795 [Dehalococcoidia bacterium]|nr:MAG: hypothetical protein D4S01_10795 [Dehalococcoidia bacterium]
MDLDKVFPLKPPFRQYRLQAVMSFTCANCKKDKTSKMVAFKDNNKDEIYCNGCVGQILSGK